MMVMELDFEIQLEKYHRTGCVCKPEVNGSFFFFSFFVNGQPCASLMLSVQDYMELPGIPPHEGSVLHLIVMNWNMLMSQHFASFFL